jgi:prepilin signal peptidase PulO-like enzyme (type II secretory pathway)
MTLPAALALRLGAALAVMRVLDVRYSDSADAHDYHAAGRQIAPALKAHDVREALRLAQTYPFDINYRLPVGTAFIRLANGAVYAAVGESKPAAYLAFSSLGFSGLVCFERAFAVAMPDADQRLFRRLLFLHPSSLFWTSSVGKEPLTALGLGLGTLGVANAFAKRARKGVAQMIAGAAVTVLARPQIPLYLGFGAGYDLEYRREAAPEGSWFEPPRVSGPLDVPKAAASVLFRPYPNEARNAPAQLAAAESTALMLFSLSRLPRAARRTTGEPFLVFVVAALLGCVAVLARLSNAGLLVRERAPMMPLYLTLVSAGGKETVG